MAAVAASGAGSTLPATHVRRLAAAVAAHDGPTPALRSQARQLVDAWACCPHLSGAAVATGLRGAADAVDRLRQSQSIDVVWTGPATPEVPVRLTREVLLEVIRSAATSLVLVSFAAYRVAAVIDGIAAAARRGVDVRFILEGGEDTGGPLKVAAAHAFAELNGLAAFYEWPPGERPALPHGGHASMHAKAALADEHTALITSANLTGLAIDSNMELGVLIRGGPVPVRLARHFRQLIVDGVLRPAAG